jgi:protein-S-isoprenylcysteine O-methyltransferase Ste14
MRATEFEFRYRSLLNAIHFWIAFQVYAFDHMNMVMAIAGGLSGGDAARAHLLIRLVFSAGAVLVGLAAAIRTWAAAYLQSSVVHDPKLHLETLVADGPFRYVRNPLYLGMFLLTIGVGFLASRLGFVILAAGGALRILRLIGREEAALEREQGQRFREYCQRVPRLLPSLSPRIAASGVKPRWGQAFSGEAMMWCCFAALVAMAITLRLKVGWIGVGGVVVGVWLLQHVARIARRKAARGL